MGGGTAQEVGTVGVINSPSLLPKLGLARVNAAVGGLEGAQGSPNSHLGKGVGWGGEGRSLLDRGTGKGELENAGKDPVSRVPKDSLEQEL